MSEAVSTRKDLIAFSKLLEAIKEPEDKSEHFTIQFKNALAKTKSHIKSELDIIRNVLTDMTKTIIEKKEELDKELCKVKKGSDVKKKGMNALIPWTDDKGRNKFIVIFEVLHLLSYEIDKNKEKEYDKKFKKIIDDEQELCEEINKWFLEDITFEVHSVDVEYVPNLDQKICDVLCVMVN